ncbi:MAG: histidine phosphatase family protein [Clostridia bacterium]|nr:histidine phosphatase family protein [Clostridia bacterium]
MRIIFIRHGDPDYERDSLTERGWREAEALSERVNKWKVDNFYCSPLGRAQHTAGVSLKKMGRTAETKDWLREFHAPINDPYDGHERIPWDLMPSYWTVRPQLYDKDRWYEAEVMKTGNVSAEFKRVCDGFDAVLKEHGYVRDGAFYRTAKGNEKTLVFFCHLGVQFVILSHLFGTSASAVWQNFFVAPTSVTELVTEEREKGIAIFRCKRLGDISHLYAASLEPSNSGFFEEVYSEST